MGDIELANAVVVTADQVTEEKAEEGERKDAGKKSFDIFTYLGFGAEEEFVEEGYAVPDLSYWQLFLTFLWFGCRAFGGPGKLQGHTST
jgi:hypothetical protein